MKRRSLLLASLVLAAVPATVSARSGDLDRGFARGGRVALAPGDGYAFAYDVRVAPGGGVRLGGLATLGYGRAQLSASGAILGRGVVSLASAGYPRRSVLRPDGSAIVASVAYAIYDGRSQAFVSVTRVNAAGAIDASFATNGTATVSTPGSDLAPAAIAVDARGRILVALDRTTGNRVEMGVLRLRPDGALDTDFAEGGIALGPPRTSAGALLVRGSGDLVVVGTERGTGAGAAIVLAGFDDQGRPLARFGRGGSVRTRMTRGVNRYGLGASDVAAGPRDTLLVAGSSPTLGGESSEIVVARYRGDGRLDRRFGRRGLYRTGSAERLRANALVRDRRGRIIVAGARGFRFNSRVQAAAVRLRPSGRPDRGFGRGGLVVRQIGKLRGVHLLASEAYDVGVTRGGRPVLAGVSYDEDILGREDFGRAYFAVARLKP